MNLYLDEDSSSQLLARLLRKAGHDVQTAFDVGNSGISDPLQLVHAILSNRTLLTHNHEDFSELHALVEIARGHHPGILLIRNDNHAKRDVNESGIVRANAKLLASGVEIADKLHILNHWR